MKKEPRWRGSEEIRRVPRKSWRAFLAEVLPKADGPRLPVVLWSRLSFDLAPYLTERMVDGSSLLNFYHRELGDVAAAVFLAEGKDQPYHARLADYFRFKADPSGDRSWTGQYPHGLSELPYHVSHSGEAGQRSLTDLLTDVLYLSARTSFTDIWQLLDDYSTVIHDGKGNVGQYCAFIAQHAQILSRHDGQLPALLYHEGFPKGKEHVDLAQRSGLYKSTWLRTEKQAAPPAREHYSSAKPGTDIKLGVSIELRG